MMPENFDFNHHYFLNNTSNKGSKKKDNIKQRKEVWKS